jgi:DNA-binding PadR family transcriptional regulator
MIKEGMAMEKARSLSELEGAILLEIEYRGQQTAFQVRRAFADSPSLEWKGSAGGVYPAVRRLERDGLVCASDPTDGRKTRSLRLSAVGREALKRWACDPLLSTSVGVDPFRLRSGIWLLLPASERISLLTALDIEISRQIAELETILPKVDPFEAARIAMALDVQRARLKYTRKWRQLDADRE